MGVIINILCLVSVFAFLMVRLKYELQMMQQNSYRNERYAKWLRSDIVSVNRIVILVVFVLSCIFINEIWLKTGVTLFAIAGIVYELTRKYKKVLVYTNRAIRLHVTSFILSLLFATVPFFVYSGDLNFSILALLLLTVLSFAVLIIANQVNAPIELAINRGYYNDAKKILEQNKDLVIIGITGSYGKTSTKHYLHRILSEKYNVLMTPGSYNTTLGVVRTIREQLKPYHEIFIVEMGAKQPGDIKEICDLVHPSIGILTSVGEQHLESFKTIENVQRTKFELIDSLPADGLAVLNLDFEYIANRKVENLKNVVYYSYARENADYHISNINYSDSGTQFSVYHNKEKVGGFSTKIVGKHNLSNILAGIIVADHLKIDMEAVKYAVSHIEQVEHRLNIRLTPAGITIIDDAFNSNPNGAEMALEVLSTFRSGRRIVVTPGMIELGDKQFDYNRRLGEQIAASADYAVVVGEYNREAIVKGLKERDFDNNKLYLAASFTEAMKHLNPQLQRGDVVLYENDLPDTFK